MQTFVGGATLDGGAVQEQILWSRSPGLYLRPDPDRSGIPLSSDPPNAYTNTVYFMRGTLGTERISWIQKHWLPSENASFNKELRIYKHIMGKSPLRCVPTLIQAWHTKEGSYLAMELPHPTGWRTATNTLSAEMVQRIVDAHKLLATRGVLHRSPNLSDILIGDDMNVSLLNYTEAAANDVHFEIASYDEKDCALEQQRLLTLLETRDDRGELSSHRFEVPVHLPTLEGEHSSKQMARTERSSPSEGTSPADLFSRCTTVSSSKTRVSSPTAPPAPSFCATETGFVDRTLPPRTKKRVRFDYGTMNNHICNGAKEYNTRKLYRQIDVLLQRPSKHDGPERRDTPTQHSSARLTPENRMQESQSAVPSSSASHLLRETNLLAPAPHQDHRRSTPSEKAGSVSEDRSHSLTYDEPAPAAVRASNEEDSEELEGTLSIVITSPTGQQHVWGAPTHILERINRFLGELGSRRSTAVPQAASTSQKRKAVGDQTERADGKRRPSRSSQASEAHEPGKSRHELDNNGAVAGVQNMETQMVSPLTASRDTASRATATVRDAGVGPHTASKRKAEPHDTEDSRKVRSRT